MTTTKAPAKSEILQQIISTLHQVCRVETGSPVTEHSQLQDDLGLDSMDLLSLALEIENAWQICLGESAENPPQTVGDLANLVTQRLSEPAVVS